MQQRYSQSESELWEVYVGFASAGFRVGSLSLFLFLLMRCGSAFVGSCLARMGSENALTFAM